MLTVKFNNGNGLGDNEFNIETIDQFRQFQNVFVTEVVTTLVEAEVAKKMEEMDEYKEDAERIIAASDYDNADDLIEWIERMQELESDLERSDYDDISNLVDRVQQLEEVIDNIRYEVEDVRRW